MSAPHSPRMTDRALRAVATVLGVASIAALFVPLAVILTPLIGNITGLFTIGITTNSAGLRFVGLAGTLGGAGLVGAFWLMANARRKT
ncbi:MAG TPA: hypothetical protein VMU22_09935 [Rhizomicrobium sp.]|nr:hypothetical protein [Rhizomicrobium sp.]